MEIESIVPPRTRLFELKSSAEFAAEGFNHNIKTWVNMASLLVKQGNMAESNKDDENAYISYVRACLIITKIIPLQPHYRSMMNDIVCIDLRQKILVIITRMGHLERRLLKRFEDENKQVAAQIKRGSTTTHLTSLSGKTAFTAMSFQQPPNPVCKVERTMTALSEEYSPPSPEESVEDQDQCNQDTIVDSNGAYDAKVEIQQGEPAIAIKDGADLMLELSPESYINHHHRRVMTTGSRNRIKVQEQDLRNMTEKPMNGTLKKKSSNEDDRSLLSPECQPNYTAMPSALFPRQREGSHVRRCSSTDAIRASIHFPPMCNTASSLSTVTALPSTTTPRSSLTTPPIPIRSDKRSSMIASVSIDRGSIGGSSTNYLRDRSSQGIVPDYRGTAAAGGNTTAAGPRGGYERDVLHSRFSNRRTMSFESNSFYPPLGGDIDGHGAHTTTNPPNATSLWRHNSTTASRVTPNSNQGHYKRASFHQQQLPRIQTESSNADLPPTPKSSLEKLNDHFSAGSASSTTSMSMASVRSFNSRSSPSPSSSPLTASSTSSPSTASSTPFTSPLMKTSAQMQQYVGVPPRRAQGHGHEYSHGHGYGHGQGHGQTPSLTSSITSSSTLAMSESTMGMSVITATDSSITYTPTSVGSPQMSCSSSSPTMTSISSWTATGKKAGLLRKIRSKPKMQEMFDMVQAPSSPSTSHSPLPLPHRQQQQQQQQQPQQPQTYPSIAMRS
ncbi:hypothetical protein BGX29_008006 [Mortierella sp. GBA35]|nr:hypothetical protein BGX29_008006 [Mortierella sp. GBA35]